LTWPYHCSFTCSAGVLEVECRTTLV
jgi:hypothetical protein